MTASGLFPYRPTGRLAPGSVAVSVVVLTKNEAVNIERCLASVQWARQVLVLDSGSTDDTVERAIRAGATVVVEPWRGYGAQREFALRLPALRHDWVYFVDADEWVSQSLGLEIAEVLDSPLHDAYGQRFRLIFQGRWIKHCGWYRGSWIVRLIRRSKVRSDGKAFGERLHVSGTTGRLQNDIVDEDRKGHASWLQKHIRYAELEAANHPGQQSARDAWRSFRHCRPTDTRPLPRAIAKDLVLPFLPARPVLLFIYMYIVARGFLDGRAGLNFCLNHAWYRLTIDALRAEHGRQPLRARPAIQVRPGRRSAGQFDERCATPSGRQAARR